MEDAATSGDSSRLAHLATCDFQIGITESDVGGFRRASKVMPGIAKALKGTKWKAKQQDYGTDVMVESESPPAKYALQFRKSEKLLWNWIGLSGVTEDDISAFLKNSYHLSNTNEGD